MGRRTLGVWVLIGLCGLTGPPPAPAPPALQEKADPDAGPLQGTWDWDPAAEQSDALPRVLVERVVIKGDTLTFHYNLGGKWFTTPTAFKLDPAARQRAIDFTPTEDGNANKGKTYVGLYEVTDGKLRICYRGPGSTRPRDFDDRKDRNGGTAFISLVRAKAAK